MKIIYANAKVENQCTSLKIATKFFGGNNSIAISLHSRINAIKGADVIKDIIVTPQFRFHKLQGKLDGYFAIDVKTRKEKCFGEDKTVCNIADIIDKYIL